MSSPGTLGPLSLFSGAGTGAGGLSFQDSTRVSFDPFADNRKSGTNNINVSTGDGFSQWMPVVLVVVGLFIFWKLLSK